MKSAADLHADALHWLHQFAQCVRDRTYEEARPLFDDGVYSFGTVADQARGLDNLVSNQWREVWDVTHGFDFDYDGAHIWTGDEFVAIAAPWSSVGSGGDGTPIDRRGRATLILRCVGGVWRAVHSHFSINPDA